MNKSLKLFLGISYLLILFVFLYFIFSYIEITRLDDFVYYKELQENLEKMVSRNIYLDLLIFFLFSIVWISLLGFGTPLLIVSGIIFGKWLGTLISVVSISLGALILYSIASFFFKELIINLFEKRFMKYIDLFNKNEFNYFFAFRLAGGLGIPFGLQNILPVIFKIKKRNYFFASFFGFIPIFFIWNTIGSGLNDYVKEADNFSMINLILSEEIYLPIILFIIMFLISGIIKRKIFDDKSK
tara:strand:+ start:70 stop:795 length:726 start_codon:yes stop_codon:yes gene_type:complete